jgi:EAL domain-containing protein (putative c-di-GMP-specific phosphodiesterase class I)
VPATSTEVDWPTLLSQAASGEGLSSHYQPIIDVERGTVVGFEALARFQGYPVQDPERWFAAAREHHQLAGLEAAALRSALARRDSLPTNSFLTVNLGPDVLDAPEVREVLRSEHTLAGLVVELTEHARVDSYAALEPAIERLRSAGAMIAIDDAGSGYAGLTHLLSLRPEFLKLDRVLVSGLQHDEAKRTLVEMVGVLAGRLDAWLLAEGVETREELDCLVGLGVPLVQGFHLARPGRDWPELDMETSLHLITTAKLRGKSTLRALLEGAPSVRREDDTRSWFADDTTDLVVVVDAGLRPVAIATPDGPLISITQDLRVNLDTDVAQAALRAITRQGDRRLAPLVCTDNAGRYVGIVRMERIVHLLASSRP